MLYSDEVIFKNYELWCNDSYFDANTAAELKKIRGDKEEIRERFCRDLEFGTGGLRGIMGAGTNRVNIYTVRRATQGLANVILSAGAAKKGVVIAYDSRKMSREFAKEAALCLAANGIMTFIFESLRPTPELSFAVLKRGCIAGVVITASHNPAEYNGYKVYWEDGAQITNPRDVEIITEINKIKYSDARTMTEREAARTGLYNVIGKEIDDLYINALKASVINPEAVKRQAASIKIVYTPLHGTGNLPVRRILAELGFSKVYVVPEQEKADGAFPTVACPNPEVPETFSLALELARSVDADIVLATDPDADRLGLYAKDTATGKYAPFTGNMFGALVCEYRLSQLKKRDMLPGNGAVVTTIVSGKMARDIAREYNVGLIETLTGFKYIGEQIKLFEKSGEREFLFGYEESYGCLVGTHARDKDAVAAAAAICEAAAYYKENGLTLCEQMKRLFKKYGFYSEALRTITLDGITGAEKIRGIMSGMRRNPPGSIGGYTVTAFCDYDKGIRIDYESGAQSEMGLPKSDVLYFEFPNDMWCCVRPSGTEPKIKLYTGVKDVSRRKAEEKLADFTESVLKLLR